MVAARLPVDEASRLRSLHALDVLDSPTESGFDALVCAAAGVCGATVSLVSLIDSHRQWIKASTGLGSLLEVPREDSFCAHAILGDGAKRFRIGTRIGLVPLDDRWAAVSGPMQAADTSCYAAKDAGRNRVHVWFDTDQAMRARYTETRRATRLEQALDEDRFVLFAQRIERIGDRSGGLHAEVPIRLVDADGSLVARRAPSCPRPSASTCRVASTVGACTPRPARWPRCPTSPPSTCWP